MRAGREEKQMRDVKEQIRVNEIRDAKSLKSRYKESDEGNGIRDANGKNKRRRFFPFSAVSSSLLVYPHPATALKFFATRLPVSRICSYLLFRSQFFLSPLGIFHFAPTY